MAQMPSSALNRAFYRQTFEIKDKGVSKIRHTMLINPEDMSVEEPNRATVTQTLGGAYLALFGQGLQTVTISGKTGFHARIGSDGTLTDGYTELIRLRNIVRGFFRNPSDQLEMFWYNWEDDEYYKIVPLSMRVQRSVSLGPMYRYEIQFICLNYVGVTSKPNPDNLVTGVLALQLGQLLVGAVSDLGEASATMEEGGKSKS
jgi:hypothetical protein